MTYAQSTQSLAILKVQVIGVILEKIAHYSAGAVLVFKSGGRIRNGNRLLTFNLWADENGVVNDGAVSTDQGCFSLIQQSVTDLIQVLGIIEDNDFKVEYHNCAHMKGVVEVEEEGMVFYQVQGRKTYLKLYDLTTVVQNPPARYAYQSDPARYGLIQAMVVSREETREGESPFWYIVDRESISVNF